MRLRSSRALGCYFFRSGVLRLASVLMTLRIAFDLDGVLADLGSILRREEQKLFGSSRDNAAVAPNGEDESPKVTRKESENERDRVVAEMTRHGLTAKQRRVLWQTITNTDNFWETLDEIEQGTVRVLAEVSATRQWEIIFLTCDP